MTKDEFYQQVLMNFNLNLTEKQLEQYDKYLNLLVTTNKKFNLTAITKNNEIYLKHFYDSLTIIKYHDLTNCSLCDIGTGAGFPGLALKIAIPSLCLTLVESNTKKCLFLNEVIKDLNLTNTIVINERSEIYSRNNSEKFDIIVARAVASLPVILECSIRALKLNGYFIAMKGNNNELLSNNNYIKELGLELVNINKFTIGQEKLKRLIIIIKKVAKTDSKYPRSYKDIKFKSL